MKIEAKFWIHFVYSYWETEKLNKEHIFPPV